MQYGYEAADRDWAERTAGNMISLEENRQEFSLHDGHRRLFKVGVCSLLGYVQEGRFLKPKTVPEHFSRIRAASPGDFRVLEEYMGDVAVGNLRSGEEVIDFPVGIRGCDFPSHVGFSLQTPHLHIYCSWYRQ